MARKKKSGAGDWLVPRNPPTKPKRIVTYDVEAKSADSQKAGFERAFMVGLYDGDPNDTDRDFPAPKEGSTVRGYRVFRNLESYKDRLDKLDPVARAIARGGCIDRFMRSIVGTKTRYLRDSRRDLCQQYARIYAHNGGAYDANFIVAWLMHPNQKEEFQFKAMIVNSRILSVTVWRNSSGGKRKKFHTSRFSWCFCDSVFLMPMSLDEVGKAFNSGNKDAQKAADFDLDTHERDPKWEVYNEADCVTLHRALQTFGQLIETMGGSIRATAASTAMDLFRRVFLKEPIARNRHFPKCKGKCGQDACLHNFIFYSYAGGRVEPFTVRYGISFRGWDINSSYPSSMLEGMPAGRAIQFGKESVKRYLNQRDFRRETMVGFVKAEVFIPDTCLIPPLPVKAETHKLMFPCGTFTGVWTDDELALLDEPSVQGKILKIEKSVWFERRPVFREYVHALYAYRKDGKKNPDDPLKVGLSALAKILINALYGKTAERKEKEILVKIRGGKDPLPGETGSPYARAGKTLDPKADMFNADLWIVPEINDSDHIVPQLAAYVTSLSRIRLWRALDAAQSLGGTIYYVDSDSVRVGAPEWLGKERKNEWYRAFEDRIGIDESELGKWSREFGGVDLGGQHWRPKLYLLEESDRKRLLSIKAKGVPKSYRTRENFEKLLRGERVPIVRRMMAKTIARTGESAPVNVNTFKSVVGAFDKRVTMMDGSTVPVFYEPRTAEERKDARNHGAVRKVTPKTMVAMVEPCPV